MSEAKGSCWEPGTGTGKEAGTAEVWLPDGGQPRVQAEGQARPQNGEVPQGRPNFVVREDDTYILEFARHVVRFPDGVWQRQCW